MRFFFFVLQRQQHRFVTNVPASVLPPCGVPPSLCNVLGPPMCQSATPLPKIAGPRRLYRPFFPSPPSSGTCLACSLSILVRARVHAPSPSKLLPETSAEGEAQTEGFFFETGSFVFSVSPVDGPLPLAPLAKLHSLGYFLSSLAKITKLLDNLVGLRNW